MNVSGSFSMSVSKYYRITHSAYEDDGHYCKDHDSFTLLSGGNSLVSVGTRLQYVCLLLFEIEKIFEL
jgi:hypothetical protein